MNYLRNYSRICGSICIALGLLIQAAFPIIAAAQSSDEDVSRLSAEIDQKRAQIDALNKEIAEQRNLLNSASGRANNLQSTIKTLEATKAKLQTDIQKTETEISRADLTIKKLSLEIIEKEYLLKRNSEGLAESMRRAHAIETTSTIDKFLGYETLSDFWNDLEMTEQIQSQLHTEVEFLARTSKELKATVAAQQNEKENLAEQKKQLAGQTEAVKYTQQEKAALLQQTKNEEATYQQLLNQKLAEKKAFESELFNIESKLTYLIDPNGYQKAGQGILSWPVSNFRITQRYGNTGFAKSNPQFYSTGFHNGVDLAVPLGTEVKAAANGVIKGFGNTDLYPGCRSWGGWLLIEHENGLSTMHAHLSSTIVSVGQKVKRGQVVAYSGSTGISTGPHLHFTLYISQAVRIRNYREVAPTARGCGAYDAYIPMGSLDSYLDPFEYLPSL